MTYIALLKGINVGGRRKILMAGLRALFEQLGYFNVKTYIQSGNVFFDYEGQESPALLEEKIQKAIAKKYGFDVPVIIRTAEEIKQAIANNPYFEEDNSHIDRLYVIFLKDIPESEQVEKIKKIEYSPDAFEIIGKELFIYYAEKYSKSKLTNIFFEKKLKVSTTARNWKTVNKLYELAK